MRASTRCRTEKVVLIGGQSTGKTSIVQRFNNGGFNPNNPSTVGAAFFSAQFSIDNKQIKLEIWDTAGSEKYKSLTPMYYRDARAAIIVFDVTSPVSLEQASEWIAELRKNGRSDCIFIGAANKIDLVTKRCISTEGVKEFAFSNMLADVRETSALTGTGVRELFECVSAQLLKLDPLIDETEPELITLVNTGGSSERQENGIFGSCDC